MPPVIPTPPPVASEPILTIGDRLQVITNLLNQPLNNGDVWFLIPQLWFDEWKKGCKSFPLHTETGVGQISTSTLIRKLGQLVNGANHNSILYVERTEGSPSFNAARYR